MSSRTSGSGLHLREPEPAPADAARPSVGGGGGEVERVAGALAAFVNASIMASSRPIQPDDDLERAGVDSMGLLKILLFVEAEFGFWMPDADLRAENVSSLRALAVYVARQRNPV